MLLCYVDESGNDQVLDRADAPPVLAIVGVVVPEAKLKELVWGFLQLKKRFNPQCAGGSLSDLIKTEIKGSSLRSDLRSSSRRRLSWATGFIDGVLDLMERCECSLTGQVRVKRDGKGISPYYYADAIAAIAADFHARLAADDLRGLMILDARTKVKNTPSVHGVTTRKFKTGGDVLHCLAESPVFGHSDAHVAIQLADIIVSALVFPMACHAYCADLSGNAHVHVGYEHIVHRWGARLRGFEHRYCDSDGCMRGGLVVRDARNQLPSLQIYGPSEPVVAMSRKRRQRRRTRAGVPVPPPHLAAATDTSPPDTVA